MFEKQKFVLTNETMVFKGRTLRRVQAVRRFRTITGEIVQKGDLGGWIERECNLSQTGRCWVGNEAKVYNGAIVADNAFVFDDSEIYDETVICSDAKVCGSTIAFGRQEISMGATFENCFITGECEWSDRHQKASEKEKRKMEKEIMGDKNCGCY